MAAPSLSRRFHACPEHPEECKSHHSMAAGVRILAIQEPVNYFCLDCEPTAYSQLLVPAIAVQQSKV